MKGIIIVAAILFLFMKALNSADSAWAEAIGEKDMAIVVNGGGTVTSPDQKVPRRLTVGMVERRRVEVARRYWIDRFNRENGEYLNRLLGFPDSLMFKQYLAFLRKAEQFEIILERKPSPEILDFIRDEIVRKRIIDRQLTGDYMSRDEFEHNRHLFGTFTERQYYECTAYSLEYRVKRYVRECIKTFFADDREQKEEILSMLNNDICTAMERHVQFGFMGDGRNTFSVKMSELGYGVFILNDRFVLVIPPELHVITCSLLNREQYEAFPKGSPMEAFIATLKKNVQNVRREIRQVFSQDRQRGMTQFKQREIALAGGFAFLRELYDVGEGTN